MQHEAKSMQVNWARVVWGIPTVLILGAVAIIDSLFMQDLYSKNYPVDGWWPGLPIDFKNTWFGAWTYFHGNLSVLFDQYQYNVARWPFFGLDVGHIWSYPLHFLMLTLPFGLLPFPVAAMIWTVVNLAAYIVFVRRTEPGLGAKGWACIVASSGFLYTMVFGQVTVITTILLVGGLLVLPKRPVLAGIAFGFLTIKPHFGVILVPLLLVDGRWKTIAVAMVTAALLLAASLLVIGVEPWLAFVRDGVPAQTAAMFEKRSLWGWMPSWYATLRILLWSKTSALTVQLCLAALCVLVVVLWRVIGLSNDEKSRLTPLLTVTALPYVLPSDMLMVAPLLARALIQEDTPSPMKLIILATQIGGTVFFAFSNGAALPLYAAFLTCTTLWLVTMSALRHIRGKMDAPQQSTAVVAPSPLSDVRSAA